MGERTNEELRALSRELLYDIQVFFRAAARLEVHATGSPELPWLEHMTALEAFAVHARGLIEFLFRDRSDRGVRPADGLAADYFEAGEWAELRPPPERTLDRVTPRVGREIAHLTYLRSELTDNLKQWPFAQIAGSIGRPQRVFIDQVDTDRVIAGFRDSVRAEFPEYLRYPIAISYSPDSWPPPTATRMAGPTGY